MDMLLGHRYRELSLLDGSTMMNHRLSNDSQERHFALYKSRKTS